MVFKLVESAQARWRAVNAPHLVALVRAGARFEKGKLTASPSYTTVHDLTGPSHWWQVKDSNLRSFRDEMYTWRLVSGTSSGPRAPTAPGPLLASFSPGRRRGPSSG